MSTSNSWPGLSGSATAHRRQSVKAPPERAGYEKVHCSPIDDAPAWLTSRLLADEQQGDNRWASWPVAVGWFLNRGWHCRRILSDNGPSIARMTGEKPVGFWI